MKFLLNSNYNILLCVWTQSYSFESLEVRAIVVALFTLISNVNICYYELGMFCTIYILPFSCSFFVVIRLDCFWELFSLDH